VTLGTVLPVGADALTVSFVPTDTTDYNTPTAPVGATITVSKAVVTTGLTVTPTTPTTYSPTTEETLTASVTVSGTPQATGTVQFFDGTTLLGMQTLAPLNGTSVASLTTTTPLKAGTHSLTAVYSGDGNYNGMTSSPVTYMVNKATPVIAWTPTVSTITVGTGLGAAQLNATATVGGTAVAGTFTYKNASGAVVTTGTMLPVGPNPLTVSFVPTDTTDYNTPTGTAAATITVNTAVPMIGVISSVNPSQFGQSVTFTVNITSTYTGAPITGTVTVLDGATVLGTPNAVNGIATVTTSALTAGSHSITAMYAGNSNFAGVTSGVTVQTVTAATTIITWPQPAGITYGTLLSATQLDATVSTANASTVAGTFVYTPPVGTLLSAGTQTLSVTFTPTDTVNFKPVTGTTTIAVGKIAPVLTWAAPTSVVAGTVLSTTQLDATAAGINGTAGLPGVFSYTPAAGTVLTAGQQTLSVLFTPTDVTDYTTATATVPLNVIAVVLSSVTPNTALLGASPTTITLTGTGFVANSVVYIDGSPVTPTFVNGTTLTAVVPAASFTTVHNIPVYVTDPTQNQTTATLNIAVTPPPVTGTIQGPTTITTGDQPSITLQLPTAYPVPITVTYVLSFAPAAGLPNDPTIVFPNGTTTDTFTLPANTTTAPAVQFQGGSIAGTITVTVTLSAGGQTLVPTPNILPLVITSPAAVPGILNVTLTRTNNVLTVAVFGYSNIREIDSIKFHFIPAAGQSLATTDITIEGSTLFPQYYSGAASEAVGSAFEYDQIFNLDQSATVVGQVQVTLVNSVGSSQVGTSQ
jgi:hypothetical protein